MSLRLLAAHGRLLASLPARGPIATTHGSLAVAYPVLGRGFASQTHKKFIKMAKGFRGRASTCYTIARRRVEKAMQYAYRDRKNRKRDFKKEWIMGINAAVRQYGLKYVLVAPRTPTCVCVAQVDVCGSVGE